MLIKVGVASIPPVTLTAMRLWLAALLLVIYLRICGDVLPKDKDAWIIFGVIGLVGNALPFSLINFGEVYIDSALAAVLMGIMPVATVILAHWFVPDEPFTAARAGGVALSFTGLLILVGWDALVGIGSAVIAQLAVLGAAISYAVSAVYARRKAKLQGRVMSTGATLMGAIWILPMAFIFENPWTVQASLQSLIAMVLLAIFPTAVGALIFFKLIKAIGANGLAQVNYLIPVLGLGWGVLLLGEQPSWRAGAALMFIVVGVMLVNQPTQKRTGVIRS